jgi:hypothetical protein
MASRSNKLLLPIKYHLPSYLMGSIEQIGIFGMDKIFLAYVDEREVHCVNEVLVTDLFHALNNRKLNGCTLPAARPVKCHLAQDRVHEVMNGVIPYCYSNLVL